MNKEDIIWLCGLLDGEACFRLNNRRSPQITLAMTDKDIIDNVAKLWESNVSHRERTEVRNTKYLGNKWKPVFSTNINGRKAIDLMVRLLETNRLSKRRTDKINEIITNWNNRPVKRLEPEQIKSLRQEFRDGATSDELAKKYKITLVNIDRHVVDIRHKIEKDYINAVIIDFKSGISRKDLATKYGVANETINRLLRRAGIYDPAGIKRWETRRNNM